MKMCDRWIIYHDMIKEGDMTYWQAIKAEYRWHRYTRLTDYKTNFKHFYYRYIDLKTIRARNNISRKIMKSNFPYYTREEWLKSIELYAIPWDDDLKDIGHGMDEYEFKKEEEK
jgi:hypothetical protein